MRAFICAVALVSLGYLHDASAISTTTMRKKVPLQSGFSADLAIGAATPDRGLSAAEQGLLREHFNAVTPENCMKPQLLQPQEGRFDFAAADALVALAYTNGLTVNGHTLIWHQQCPAWFFMDGTAAASREKVLARMRTHISTVVGHFAGKLESWDVVNEALDDGDQFLRDSDWLRSIGPDFITEAFMAAHQADPQARLYYNDYHIELPHKRAKALRLIRELKERQVPLHGIGIQGHWQLDRIPFKELEEAIIVFHAQGLQVMITELDIDVVTPATTGRAWDAQQPDSDPFAQGLPEELQQRLAAQYAQLFALLRKHRDKLTRITFWGLHDGRSWLNYWPTRRTNHPLLWDRQLTPKPALSAILEGSVQ